MFDLQVADIGHCTLPFEQHEIWLRWLQEEMFAQVRSPPTNTCDVFCSECCCAVSSLRRPMPTVTRESFSCHLFTHLKFLASYVLLSMQGDVERLATLEISPLMDRHKPGYEPPSPTHTCARVGSPCRCTVCRGLHQPALPLPYS